MSYMLLQEFKRKRPKNIAEAKAWDEFTKLGWTITKRGWPDFFCMKPDGSMMVVEIKPRGSHPLKKSQQLVLEALADRGIACYRWTPDTGLEPIQSPGYKLFQKHCFHPTTEQCRVAISQK